MSWVSELKSFTGLICFDLGRVLVFSLCFTFAWDMQNAKFGGVILARNELILIYILALILSTLACFSAIRVVFRSF